MNKLLLAALPLLALSACQGTGDYCRRVGIIAAVPAPDDAPETAENKYDTPATVKRIEVHNRVVGEACGALPVQPNG